MSNIKYQMGKNPTLNHSGNNNNIHQRLTAIERKLDILINNSSGTGGGNGHPTTWFKYECPEGYTVGGGGAPGAGQDYQAADNAGQAIAMVQAECPDRWRTAVY